MKKGQSDHKYKDELEKVKNDYERDSAKFKLKILSYKESIREKDSQISEMQAKLRLLLRDDAKFNNMERYITKLENELDELKAKQTVEFEQMKM